MKQRVLARNVAELELKDRKLKLKEERGELYGDEDDANDGSAATSPLSAAQRVLLGAQSGTNAAVGTSAAADSGASSTQRSPPAASHEARADEAADDDDNDDVSWKPS